MKTFLWLLAANIALELLSHAVYRWKGYRLQIKLVSFAYADGRIIWWDWHVGKRVQNEYDDKTDRRHIPRTLRDYGFAVEPWYLRITFKKTKPIKEGSGREYESAEQRLRVHEHQRMKHGRVLPDYTPDDYDALIGKWIPPTEATTKLDTKARRAAERKARQTSTETAD